MYASSRRVFLAEGTANAKALRQEDVNQIKEEQNVGSREGLGDELPSVLRALALTVRTAELSLE